MQAGDDHQPEAKPEGPASEPRGPTEPPEPRSAWTTLGLAQAAIIAALALGAGAGLGTLIAREPAPSPASPEPRPPLPAGPAERALLAPLTEGAPLGDYEVREIHAVDPEGRLRIVCVKGRAEGRAEGREKRREVVRLDVVLASEGGPEPPAETMRYAIFYSLKGAPPEDGERLAKALAEVLQKNEAAPPPPGMAPYTPQPRQSPPI